MTDLDKIRAKRKAGRMAVLREILDADERGARILGSENTGFAIDLLEQGFIRCNDAGDLWTIRAPQAARCALDAPPGDEDPIYWNDMPVDQRPNVTFDVAVLLVGSESDGYYFLASFEDWHTDERISIQDNVFRISSDRVAHFVDLKEFINFCVEHKVTIQHSSEVVFG